MTVFDEGLNTLVLGIALLIAGSPFLALYVRDSLVPASHVRPRKNPINFPSKLLGTTLGLFLALASFTSASGQQLFVLSTDAGLEIYQVEPIKKPNLFPSKNFSALWPTSNEFIPINMPTLKLPGTQSSNVLIDPGFRTSVSGRILTIAGRIDWSSSETENQFAKKMDMKDALIPNTEQMAMVQPTAGQGNEEIIEFSPAN